VWMWLLRGVTKQLGRLQRYRDSLINSVFTVLMFHTWEYVWEYVLAKFALEFIVRTRTF
jgi:glucose uptake protein GlcU